MVFVFKSISNILFFLSIFNGVQSLCYRANLKRTTLTRTLSDCRILKDSGRELCFYTCKKGYFIPQEAEAEYSEHSQVSGFIECIDDDWTAVSCIKACPMLPTIHNGFYVNQQCRENRVAQMSTCEFDCFEGFHPNPALRSKEVDSQKVFFIQCVGGSWDSAANCIKDESPNKCEAFIPPPESTFRITECKLDLPKPLCHFICEEGLVSDNTASRVIADRQRPYSGVIECTEKIWQVPRCAAICEEVLEPIENVLFYNEECTSPAAQNTDCLFQCAPGFQIPRSLEKANGSGEIMGVVRCDENGWAQPFCEPIGSTIPFDVDIFELPQYCSPIGLHNPSAISLSCATDTMILNGTKCTMQCAHGPFVDLENNEIDVTLQCDNGQWISPNSQIFDFTKFVCPLDFAVCQTLPAPENCAFNGVGCVENALSGAKCAFTCDSGLIAAPAGGKQYSPNNGVITCVAGRWELPVCSAEGVSRVEEGLDIAQNEVILGCGPRPAISNGKYVGGETNPSFYVCDENEDLDPNEQQIVCQNGVWSEPACQLIPEILSALNKKDIDLNIVIDIRNGSRVSNANISSKNLSAVSKNVVEAKSTEEFSSGVLGLFFCGWRLWLAFVSAVVLS